MGDAQRRANARWPVWLKSARRRPGSVTAGRLPSQVLPSQFPASALRRQSTEHLHRFVYSTPAPLRSTAFRDRYCGHDALQVLRVLNVPAVPDYLQEKLVGPPNRPE
jgi:hypothetical protein